MLFNDLLAVEKADAREAGYAEGRAEGLEAGRAEGRTEGIAEGLAEGRLETAEQNAINFLKMKLGSFEQIAQGTGLSVERVQELAQTLNVVR